MITVSTAFEKWIVLLIIQDLKHDFPFFIYLYRRIKKERLNKKDIATILKNHQELKFMDCRVKLYNDFIRGQQLQKQQLEQEIEILQSKIKDMKANFNSNIFLK